MPPLTADLLATILKYVLQYGPGALQAIVDLFKSGNPTQEQWQALLAATQSTARQQMLAALVRAGIDPNSDQGKAMLALTP